MANKEKVFAKDISAKGLLSKIYTKQLNFNNKKMNTSPKKI